MKENVVGDANRFVTAIPSGFCLRLSAHLIGGAAGVVLRFHAEPFATSIKHKADTTIPYDSA
ncbi:MAG: hypothetical protein WKF30_00990 [Pyrinomonadaceae bacterium]